MGIRYDDRNRGTLSDDFYKEFLEDRGISKAQHFTTAHIGGLNSRIRSSFKVIEHIWGSGDHFYKLAQKHYGNPKLWWLIAWYNTTPTEAHVKLGDTIRIPTPLERALYYYNNPRV
jgi:nucleoid-associated protein YgaU